MTGVLKNFDFFLFVLIQWTLQLQCFPVKSATISATFNSHSQLSHLAVNNLTGAVYVGAVDHLYQMSENLDDVITAITGPRLDNRICYQQYYGSSCLSFQGTNQTASNITNTNQILAFDLKRNRLIACGTLYHGACQGWNLSNISNSLGYTGQNTNNYRPIGSNNMSYPMGGIIAPGPLGDDVLYVVSAFTGDRNDETNMMDCYSGLCSRSLTENSDFDAIPTPSGNPNSNYLVANIDKSFASMYKFSYVAGFSVQGYSYFLIRQSEVPDAFPVSKIMQVCQSDLYGTSYIEQQIQCNTTNVNYIMIQAGAFVRLSTGDYVLFGVFSGNSTALSAVCVYRLEDLRRSFTASIQACYKGQGLVGYIYRRDRQCAPNTYSINDSFCGTSWSSNSPLVGTFPLFSSPLNLGLEKVNITAVASGVINNYTFLLLGTSDGQLLKFVVNGANGFQYDSIHFDDDNSTVNKDLVFNGIMTHVYVMTALKIYKVRLFECDKYTTCTNCLSARDPFCGWCSLERRCSIRQDCMNSNLYRRWVFPDLLGDTQECPKILSISPSSVDVNATAFVSLIFHGLPPSQTGEYYSCIFGSDNVVSTAGNNTDQLTCQTPNNYIIPSNNLSIILSVQISALNISFVDTLFSFYNCSSFSFCSACTTIGLNFNCHWCLNKNLCQHELLSCSAGAMTSSSQCPNIWPNNNEILVASGRQQLVMVYVSNLQSIVTTGSDVYKCRLNFEVPVDLEASQFNNTHIQCQNFQYTTSMKSETAELTVLWGEHRYLLEGSYNITVFNCSALAEGDCSICLSLIYDPDRSKYRCIWCDNACQLNDSCAKPNLDCPDSTITSITPDRVPVDGRSYVTITGTNLGYNFMKVKVLVNGILCTGDGMEYIASKRYVFITNSSNRGPGVVIVTVTNGLGVSSNYSREIQFTDPLLSMMKPLSGLKAGGTLVTLYGTDLLSGSTKNLKILIGTITCKLQSVNETNIICETMQADSRNDSFDIITNETKVQFDNAYRYLHQDFIFIQDPTIDSTILPDGSFKSGGCIITITGNNLNISTSSRVVIGKEITTAVFKRDLTHFMFFSPAMNYSLMSKSEYNASLELDAVKLNFKFLIYPDPIIYDLDNSGDVYNAGSTLHLKGTGLKTPCVDNNTKVKVGTQTCAITSQIDTDLYCSVPPLSPGEVPDVTVEVGQSLVFRPGRLNLQAPPIPWAIAIGVIGGISVIVILIIIIIFVVKRVQSTKRILKLQHQLDFLESSVRNECRLAFTELQTEVSDFNSDLEVKGIPFWDFRMYAFKLLFPTVHNHPVLYANKSVNKFGGFDEQMHQFNQLLSSKFFILTFIHVLDKQLRAFSINDRAKVSSLLGVILLNRMEFATDILKELLSDLIDRSVEKKNPKLMLRSTESLVEKLLANWLSLSMFQYLRDGPAGDHLFMLFKAIKHHIEKGPIDAVTGEAKNTLSEDRLLRETIETAAIAITVNDGQTTVSCKVLLCDTISQAKEKALDAIYKNAPYSSRPSLYDLDLRWIDGSSSVLLCDEDSKTVLDHGWKQINTLASYNIPDGASLILSAKPLHTEDSIENVDECMSKTFGYSLKSTTERDKIWHLVKHEDNRNSNRTQKVISEIFLTRILSSKMILEEYVKDLFETIFKVDSTLPPVIKYLYDFLDRGAHKHGITDEEVIHAWKSNSLLLRFWVNIITNPGFVFDINQADVTSSCLAVIAQAFMDSCSTHELHLGKDSPSTKLLFAKDVPKYRKFVQQFFINIRSLPPVSDTEMEAKMKEMSMRNRPEFNMESALQDLYFYANKFQFELMVALGENPGAQRMHLLQKFQQLQQAINNGHMEE